MISIGFWDIFYASSLIAPGLATVLAYTQLLIAGIPGWHLLSVRIRNQALLGTLLGFAGIVVISVESLLSKENQPLNGVVFVLIAFTGIASSNILLKKLTIVSIFFSPWVFNYYWDQYFWAC